MKAAVCFSSIALNFLLAAPAMPAAAQAGQSLAQAQALIDAGRAEAALPLLDQLLAREPANARALLLRSTARFLKDDLAGGRKDLDRALELDPGQRQAWLHRAALEVADQQYEAALASFGRAETLDPQAPDNHLNIGAVLLLQGKLQPASERFQRYLAQQPGSADAAYLVASNYALAGYAALALGQLERAIALDERARLRARTDSNFASLSSHPRFKQLLATDSYRLPPGAHRASRAYDIPYDAEDGHLLGSVLQAMRTAGERFDPRVESTPDWALIWGDLRVKVGRGAGGKGLVEVSGPADRIPAPEWRERTDKLFRAVGIELIARQVSGTKKKRN